MGIFKTRLPPAEVDALRDSALALEDSNLELAARLMHIAKHHRPDGHLINQKCEEYSERLRLPEQEQNQVQEAISKEETADRSTELHGEASHLDRQQSGWHNSQTQELIKGFKINDTDTVIDVGCGGAGHSIFCGRWASEVIYCDLNPESVEKMAKTMSELATCKHRGFVANAEALDLDNELATKVICNEVLEHVDSPGKAMSELFRIGRPGCHYLLTVPDETGELVQKGIAPPQYFEKPHHIRVYSRDSFAQLVEDSGLIVEDRLFYGFYHALWWTLFWDDRKDLLEKWSDLWILLLANEKGCTVKAALDAVVPKTQIILARKPHPGEA